MIDLGRWLEEEIGLPHEGGPTKNEVIEDHSTDSDRDPY